MNTNFYRGYMKLSEDKRPYLNRKRMSRDIPNWPTVGGIFAADYMMLDFDTYEDSDLFMQLVDKYKWKCHIVATDSGLHAVFRKPDYHLPSENGAELICGLRADIKQGRRDWKSSDYECIIKHGKQREIIEACEDPQVLPWQLTRLSKKLNLKNVGDGDGRHGIHKQIINAALYHTSDAKEICDLVCWVNDNVFDVPRESVNWKANELQKWIDKNIKEDSTIEELLQQYNVDLHKLNVFIKTEFEVK